MLTPQSNQMQSKIHLHAIFCELQPNQRVLKYFSRFLHFQPALHPWTLWTLIIFEHCKIILKHCEHCVIIILNTV